MKIHVTLTSLLSVAILILSSAYSVQGAATTRFSIVYTNDVMGEVEPCG